MKIAHLLDSLNRGGAEILALDICRNAKNNDLDLTFITTGDGALKEDFRQSGAEFIELKRKLPIDLQVIFKLRKFIKDRKIDVIHTHQSVEAVHAYFAAKGTKTKIILTHHGYVPDKKNLYALRFLLPRVAQNIVVSRALLKWYAEEIKLKFPQNTKVIHNGVDAKRLNWKGDKLKKELGLTEDSFLFGMIGNFYRDPRKDQLTVCKALPKIFDKVENAHFVFVGKTENGAENKYEDCVKFCNENKINDRVFFLGARSDVPKILNSLDVFVLSSFHEGLPIAVLEAMLTGISCVLSDIEPLWEVSKSGEYAEIFQTQNAESLAEKIIGLAENEQHRLKLAQDAKIYAEENFSIVAHIENLKKLYESTI
jgi:L-malate glycosyltransferase